MQFLLPFAVAIPAWLILINELRARRIARAIGFMLLWALGLAIFSTTLSYARPDLAAAWFWNAEPFWQEMSEWLRTGYGLEGEPARFIPRHGVHIVVFAILSLATASALSLPMGAALMHYMGYYVGQVAAQSDAPFIAALVAWHPWAIVRIVSFIVIGVVLAQPLLATRFGFRVSWDQHRPLLIAAGIGLIVDVVMKWLLAEPWRQLLLSL